ncbi:transmembrane 4 L6 family member 1-like [Grus japonensis]|uniref:Transmembrane 4 L6 family member 1-like n=1 Tax=Grus japonensis TaxID=30415 RepID=A0ABC9W579_GRUJA
MCTGKCSKCIGITLFPLAACAIVSNVLLYFPNGRVLQLSEITDLVWFFHGILGAGILMLLSVVLSVLGFAGGVYCAVISSLGLIGGPLCDTGDGEYLYPFRNDTLEDNYLFNQTTWSICKEPENIILWNIVLFSILLAIGVIEAILCFIQVISGLTGFICGSCMRKRKATETEVLWAMRTSMLVFGAGAAGLAFYSSSVYDLWFLSGELVYALLFPQLCCSLFAPNTNTYGSAAGFLVGLLLRLLAGEPALSIPPVICYSACSLVNGTYSQLFPFKTFTMLLTLGMIVAVSYLAAVLFQRNLLPRRWDVCNIMGGTGTILPLQQVEKQTDSPTVALEENRD